MSPATSDDTQNPIDDASRENEELRQQLEEARQQLEVTREQLEETRQALEAARAKQQAGDSAFKRFSDSGMIGIGMLDPRGCFEFANSALCEMVGCSEQDLKGTRWGELSTLEHTGQVSGALEELRTRGGCFPFEAEYSRPDGGRFWALFFGVGLEPGKSVAFVIDTTRRHFLENEARLLNETLQQRVNELQLLATIVETSQDAILTKSLDGIITSWNAGAARLYGYSADEIVGRSVSILAPPGLAGEIDRIMELLRQGKRIETYETQRVTRDGRRLDISLTVSPVPDPFGTLIGASAIARDITGQKRMERELQERNEQIETQAEELEAQFEELQVQHDELGRQDRQRNEFLAMLAHELRNPLAPIMSAAEVMRIRGLSDPLLERQRDIISRQVRHLVRLVDDLLDVARIVQGKVALRRDTVDLADVVDQALQISGALIEERSHRLSVSLPAARLLVEGDATRLVQVVCNLLNNAARYTDPGGEIWLTVESEIASSSPAPPGQRPSHEAEKSEAAIRVRDTGRGIAPELIGSIFDVFVQADRTLARSEGGLGVGLTLARSLVEQHSGKIVAHSEGPGQGSEFTVRLPLLVARSPSEAGSEGPPPGPQPARRVLVVDDNPDALETLADLLSLDGHIVWTAPSGPDGLALAEQKRPDLVLLDLGMPVMDGFEVARRLRAHPELKNVPLGAITGYGYSSDRSASREAGFDFHLTKPVNLEVLRDLLKKTHG